MGVFNALGDNTTPNQYPADGQCRKEPTVEPGQIWLVECGSASLSAFHTSLMAGANVVLYDRALSGAVADSLPTGTYAEPLPPIGSTGAAGSAIAPRALQFAADGWSVLQLVESSLGWRQRLQFATEAPNGPGGRTSPLLAIGTITVDRYRQQRGVPDPTDIAIIAAGLRSDELLSLTFAPLVAPGLRGPAQGQVFTANGLAG